MTLQARKSRARAAAIARRRDAHAAAAPEDAALLRDVLLATRGLPLSGFAPIRTEIDPMPAMAEMARHGAVALPVIDGPGRPLAFRAWHPGARMVEGPFGARIPAEGEWIVPRVLIVPLLAFDRRGGRLGYGGGFYDRTLAALRLAGPVRAIGFAFAAQEDADLPLESTDEPLDLIVTEREVIDPRAP